MKKLIERVCDWFFLKRNYEEEDEECSSGFYHNKEPLINNKTLEKMREAHNSVSERY